MTSTPNQVNPLIQISDYDRQSDLKAFDESKSGVKGLVDAGLTKIPPFFIHNHQHIINHANSSMITNHTHLQIPVIDLEETNSRSKIIAKVRDACENWGFFQIINHEIPNRVMDEMINGVRAFHEMDTHEKTKYYTRDIKNKFIYVSNFHLFKDSAADWNDQFMSAMAPIRPQPDELPPICRDILMEYSDHVMKLGLTIMGLLSEALGLEPNHLEREGCGEGLYVVGHYNPGCPEPEKAIGIHPHTDVGFFTIVLQDLLGGLQVLHQNEWVDVTPVPGAFVVNIAELLQLISNDKFKSAKHRVLAQKAGPRISLATFFRPFYEGNELKMYKPIKELVSEENPCVYRETSLKEYMTLRGAEDKKRRSVLTSLKVVNNEK